MMNLGLSRSMENLNEFARHHRGEQTDDERLARAKDVTTAAEVASSGDPLRSKTAVASPSWLHFFGGRDKGTAAAHRRRLSEPPPEDQVPAARLRRYSCCDMDDGRLFSVPSSVPSSILEEELCCDDDDGDDESSVVSELTLMTYSAERAQTIKEEFLRRLKTHMLEKDWRVPNRERVEALLREVQDEQDLKFQREKEMERMRRRRSRDEGALGEEKKQEIFEALGALRMEKEDVKREGYSSGEELELGKIFQADEQELPDLDLEILEKLSRSRRADLATSQARNHSSSIELRRVVSMANNSSQARIAQAQMSTINLRRPDSFAHTPSQARPPQGYHSAYDLRRANNPTISSLRRRSSMESCSSAATAKCHNVTANTSKRNFDWTYDVSNNTQTKRVHDEGLPAPHVVDFVNTFVNSKSIGSKYEPRSTKQMIRHEKEEIEHGQEHPHHPKTESCYAEKQQTSTVPPIELGLRINDIIELKLLVAEQQATIDTLSSKLHNLELENRRIMDSEASRREELEERNRELERQLREYRDSEMLPKEVSLTKQQKWQSFRNKRNGSHCSDKSEGSNVSNGSAKSPRQ